MASIMINESYTFALAYLDEFVDFRCSSKSKTDLYDLVVRVIRHQKHYWKKINVEAYALGFYFTIHERWFLCSFEHIENFDIKAFHEAYWIGIALHMRYKNYDDEHISDVIKTAMRNFLTLPYKLNYKVIVPFLCALVGGKSGKPKEIDALIACLAKVEQECLKNASRFSRQTLESPEKKINEILNAKDQFSKLILPLIFTLKKNPAFIVSQQPIEESITTHESRTPTQEHIKQIEVCKEVKPQTNTAPIISASCPSVEPTPIAKNTNLGSNSYEVKASKNSLPMKPTNQAPKKNKVVKFLWLVFMAMLMIFSLLIFFSGRSTTIDKSIKSPTFIEKTPQEEIKCLTLERQLTLIRPLANNHAQKVIISDWELDQSYACKNISRTTVAYKVAQEYVKGQDEQIKSMVMQALEQATERFNENMHNNIPEMKKGGSITVYEAQVALRKLGFELIPDGIDGPNTQIAVKEFQKKIGVAQTGKIDNELMVALSAELALESL